MLRCETFTLTGFELLLDRGQRILRLRTRATQQSGPFLQRPGAVVGDRSGIQDAQHVRLLLESCRRAQGSRIRLAQSEIGGAKRLLDLGIEGTSIFRFSRRVAAADFEGGVKLHLRFDRAAELVREGRIEPRNLRL